MSHQSNDSNGVVFQFVMYAFVTSVVLTAFFNIWIHWIPVLLGVTVSTWAIQSAGKTKH